MFMVFAVVFGLIQKKWNLSGWKEAVVGIVFIIASFVIGNQPHWKNCCKKDIYKCDIAPCVLA